MHIIFENKIVLVTIILLIVATLISFSRKSGQRQFRRYAFLIILVVVCLYRMNFNKQNVETRSAEVEEEVAVEEEEEQNFYIDVCEGEDEFGSYLNDYLNPSEDSCMASSRLRPDKDWYIPYRIVDGTIDTCWQEGVDGYGEEEYVEFHFDEPVLLGHFSIMNGKAKTQEDYEKNGRICDIEYMDSLDRIQTITLQDLNELQCFYISTPEEVEWIRFTIKSVYESSAYQDTCLSQISFYE